MNAHGSTLAFSHNVTVIKDGQATTYKNRVLQSGILWLAGFVMGEIGDEISHIAVGDDPTPNTIDTEEMGNELFRKPYTAKYMNGTYPTYETFFLTEEANFRWREIGMLAGGSETPGSGLLVARVVVDEEKNDNVTVSLLWEFRIANTT